MRSAAHENLIRPVRFPRESAAAFMSGLVFVACHAALLADECPTAPVARGFWFWLTLGYSNGGHAGTSHSRSMASAMAGNSIPSSFMSVRKRDSAAGELPLIPSHFWTAFGR